MRGEYPARVSRGQSLSETSLKQGRNAKKTNGSIFIASKLVPFVRLAFFFQFCSFLRQNWTFSLKNAMFLGVSGPKTTETKFLRNKGKLNKTTILIAWTGVNLDQNMLQNSPKNAERTKGSILTHPPSPPFWPPSSGGLETLHKTCCGHLDFAERG